jgi:hypothetical protein
MTVGGLKSARVIHWSQGWELYELYVGIILSREEFIPLFHHSKVEIGMLAWKVGLELG